MTLSIRARLTLWYRSIVVLVLVTAAVVGSLAQSRLAVQRLDEHVLRTMATLEGVMRTEFGEGLGLEAAAGEASAEVVAPDRTMALTRSDGTVLQVWGLPIDRDAVSSIGSIAGPSTVRSIAGDLRVLRHQVEYARNTYVAVVMARLAQYRAQQAEMVRALALGALIALIAAAATGWIIGRQTLKPLTRMADQARGMDAREPRDRLAAPPVDDELGRLAAAFNGLLDRLAAALNHQRQFMADASHEPRTPVSVVRTATQVTLLRDDRTADEYRESLEIIGEQATRLTRVVDAMFLLSRAEADGVPLRREFLNLDDVLVESARAVRVLAKQRGVKIATNGDEEVGLTGDATLLRRMVGNLLDNAVRHAEPDGSVSAGLERSPDRVALRITNDGPGIPAADQARIFERFVRMGTSDGAGLGRPIARWIAEAHGGTLALDGSAPGRTTFVVTLPLDHVINRSSAREQDQNLSQEGQEIRSFLFPGKNS